MTLFHPLSQITKTINALQSFTSSFFVLYYILGDLTYCFESISKTEDSTVLFSLIEKSGKITAQVTFTKHSSQKL